jgi:hypothetical protein
MWNWIRRDTGGVNLDLCFSDSVQEAQVDVFISAIEHLISRCEAFRTSFFVDDGGRVVQQVAGHGFVEIFHHEVRQEDASGAVEELSEYLSRAMINVCEEPPIRLGFISSSGLVKHVVFVVSRLVADGGGCDHLILLLKETLSEGRRFSTHRNFHQIDQYEWESSENGDRARVRSLAHARAQIERYMSQARHIPPLHVKNDGAMLTATVTSTKMMERAECLAHELRVSSSAVFLAAFCRALTGIFECDQVPLFLHCSNRFDDVRRSSVTRLKSLAIYVYKSRDGEFKESLMSVYRESLTSYLHAQIPEADFESVVKSNESSREYVADFFHYNDRRSVIASPIPHPGVHVEREGGAERVVEVVSPLEQSQPYPSFTLYVDHAPDPDAVTLAVNTNLLSLKGISRFFREMGEILEEAVDTARR